MKRSLILLLLVGCGSDNGNPAVDAAMPPIDGVPPSEVRFQRDVVPIFNRSCGSGTEGCHDRKIYGANQNMDCRGWLSLENASIGSQFYGGPNAGQSTGCPDKTLHERLTQITVWQCRTGAMRNYIKSGDLGNSYVIDKIRGTDLCNTDGRTTVSDRMPPPPPDSNFVLPDGDKQTLEAWVMAGAKND